MKAMGTCHSTDQNGTRKSRNVSCRVVNSVGILRKSEGLISEIIFSQK